MLERSSRTIKRDLQYMRDQLGAPLRYDHSRGGWRYLEVGWTPPPVRIGEGELLAFFTAEKLLRSAGHTPEAILLRNALAKLATFLPDEVSVNLTTLSESLTFQQSPHVEVEPTILDGLAHAAAKQQTVAFDYYSQHRNVQTHREADILLLHNFAGDWYAVAFDHSRKEVRDFHVGRIKQLRKTPKYFVIPEEWDSKDYLRKGFYMMRGGRRTKVSIVFDAYQARWMRERQPFHMDEHREELPDGELRISFPVGTNGMEAVARFCLAYAGHCRAERPATLRNLIVEKLSNALDQHKDKFGSTK
jgi:predicted DNA-binding transcriptional regulator YafY